MSTARGTLGSGLLESNVVPWTRTPRDTELGGKSDTHIPVSLLPCSLVQEHPEVIMDCVAYLSQHLTPAERMQVAQLLSTKESPASP